MIIAVLAVAAVAAIVVAVVVLNDSRSSEQPSGSSSAESTAGDADGSTGSGEEPTTDDGAAYEEDDKAAGPTPEESYDIVYQAYVDAGSLGDEIGKARTDGAYGGTGFAYERFNPSIGAQDRATRARLLEDCEALVTRVSEARDALRNQAIDISCESQRAQVLVLYDYLFERASAMKDAAEVAVGNPDESAWRPVLQPRSTDARKAFDAAYPGAALTAP